MVRVGTRPLRKCLFVTIVMIYSVAFDSQHGHGEPCPYDCKGSVRCCPTGSHIGLPLQFILYHSFILFRRGDPVWSPETLPIYQLKSRASVFTLISDFYSRFACGGFAAKLSFISQALLMNSVYVKV